MMRICSLVFLVFTAIGVTGGSQAADALSETQNLVQEWVRTEQLISQERRQWQEEQAAIGSILRILEAEESELRDQISRAREVTSRADEERAALVAELSGYEATSQTLEVVVSDYERQLGLLQNYLPAPLQEELAPRFTRISSSTTGVGLSLSERTQTVFSVMAAISNFDSRINLTTQVIEGLQDRTTEVSVLYFGMGRAFYVNTNGTLAGYGAPSEGGWQWEPNNELGSTITRAIGIFEARESPQLIDLPMEIDP